MFTFNLIFCFFIKKYNNFQNKANRFQICQTSLQLSIVFGFDRKIYFVSASSLGLEVKLNVILFNKIETKDIKFTVFMQSNS